MPAIGQFPSVDRVELTKRVERGVQVVMCG